MCALLLSCHLTSQIESHNEAEKTFVLVPLSMCLLGNVNKKTPCYWQGRAEELHLVRQHPRHL